MSLFVSPYVSKSHDMRPAYIDMLILHYTGMKTAHAALERLCDPAASVSAHYVVDEDGSIFTLVPEHRRAWHAGASFWRGRTGLNSYSIGIEIVNPGHEFGYRVFPYTQMNAVISLCQDIVRRYNIFPYNIVAHSDVSPQRKEDPGELFEWVCLARAGVGVWPLPCDDPAPVDEYNVEKLLVDIGYETISLSATLRAFQRRYRPSMINGEADEETRRRLAAVHAAFMRY